MFITLSLLCFKRKEKKATHDSYWNTFLGDLSVLKKHSFPSELWPAWTSFAYSEITAGQTLSVRIRKSGDQRQLCKFFWIYSRFLDTECLQLRLVVTLHLYLLGTANLTSWEKLETCNAVCNKFSNSLKCYEFPKRLAVLAAGYVGKSQNPTEDEIAETRVSGSQLK